MNETPKLETAGHREEGMTLIEVMIAAAVLATAIVAMLGVIVTNSRVKALAEEQFTAMNAAQLMMAQIREYAQSNFDDLADIYDGDSGDAADSIWGGSAPHTWSYYDPVAKATSNRHHNEFAAYNTTHLGMPASTLQPPDNQPLHTAGFPHGVVAVSATADGTYDVQITVRWRSVVTGRNEQVTLSAVLINRHPAAGS